MEPFACVYITNTDIYRGSLGSFSPQKVKYSVRTLQRDPTKFKRHGTYLESKAERCKITITSVLRCEPFP